jgi:hypothetical protein
MEEITRSVGSGLIWFEAIVCGRLGMLFEGLIVEGSLRIGHDGAFGTAAVRIGQDGAFGAVLIWYRWKSGWEWKDGERSCVPFQSKFPQGANGFRRLVQLVRILPLQRMYYPLDHLVDGNTHDYS